MTQLKSPLPSVKSLHLEIEGCQSQIQIIQDINGLVSMLPRLSEIHFILPPHYSDWIAPYSELMPTEPHLLRVLGVKTYKGRNTISLLYRTKYVEPSINVLSGISGVAMEFARMLGSLGSLSMTRIGLLEQCSSSIRFSCLRISDSDLKVAAYAPEDNILPNTSVSLQCVGAPLHPGEITCLARTVYHIRDTLENQEIHPRDYLGKPSAVDIRDPERAKAFRVISLRVERRHPVRSAAHYIAEQNESILSLSGAIMPALQLLGIVAEAGCPLPDFNGGTPRAFPPLSPRAFVTSLSLYIEENWNWTIIAADINDLIATLPRLCSVHLILPAMRWRQTTSTPTSQEDQIMQPLDSRSKASCLIGSPSGADCVFSEFVSILGAMHGVYFSYGVLRKNEECNSIASAPRYLGIRGETFNRSLLPSTVSTIAPFPHLLTFSKDQKYGLRSDGPFMLAKLTRHGEL
jgi:hypothetical protein